MSLSAEPLFPPRGGRGYDAAAVETFPWPVVAGYEDVHRWMDQGQAVHTAWQLRDVWEGLLKFLATLAVADHLAAAPAEDPAYQKAAWPAAQEGRPEQWHLGDTDGNHAQGWSLAPRTSAPTRSLAVPGRQATTALSPVHGRQKRRYPR